MRQKHDIDQVAGKFPAAPQSEIITLELSPDLAAALDRFIEREHAVMTRSEAMADLQLISASPVPRGSAWRTVVQFFT